MVSMNELIAASTMNAHINCANNVKVGPITRGPWRGDKYYVDIRFGTYKMGMAEDVFIPAEHKIQPNSLHHTKKARTGSGINDPVGSSANRTGTTESADNLVKKLTRGLVTRTSNLARKTRRRVATSEVRAVWRGFVAREESVITNETPVPQEDISSSHSKRGPGGERAASDESSYSLPSDYMPNRFKRRRLIFEGGTKANLE